jgi:hypothetical protein
MAHTVDSISIKGLRKAHLKQLASYIRDRDGCYYGPREQFEKRHADLLAFADRIEAIADDTDARIPEQTKEKKRLVTEEMREAGTEIASDLVDANISFHMGGLGGSLDWEEFESSYSGKNIDLIKQAMADEIDIVTAMYTAMHRESIISNDTRNTRKR